MTSPTMRPQPPLWRHRREAGLALGHQLLRHGPLDADALLLGFPRGGVAVAAAMAEVLQRPLASWCVRKVSDPHWPEVAIGAIAPGGVCLWREGSDGPAQARARAQGWLQKEVRELMRRRELFGDPDPGDLAGRHLIAVDDGIATGMTALAGLTSLRQIGPARLTLAVPVLDAAILRRVKPLVDELEVLERVEGLEAVGAWYADFPQLEDREVLELLAGGKPREPGSAGGGSAQQA